MSINPITASEIKIQKKSSKNSSFGAKQTFSEKISAHKDKLPYVGAGVALAIIAGVYCLKGKSSVAKDFRKELGLNNPEYLQRIKDVKARCKGEFNKILSDNTFFGEIKLDNMDRAAEFRALDKTRPDYLHEAANMAEEAYKAAYLKAAPQEGKNILDRIAFRIENESKTLPNLYAKLPREEALERINVFATSAYEAQPQKGMSVETLFNKIVDFMGQV